MAITKLITGSITDETITSTKIDDGAITNAKINASAGIDISKTVFTGAQPTISALSISQKDPDVSSNVTITGTNFESIPIVQFLNTTTGARITSATVTYTSSTSITAVFPASQTVGIYKVIVENPTSLSVISTATLINSNAPNWVTNASLGSFEEGDTVNIQLLAYDDDSSAVSSYSLQSGSLPSGVTLSGDSTIGALTGTAPQVAADTAYNFTVRATDDESQTTDKAFSLTIADYNIGNSLMFNDNDSAYLSRTPSSTGNRKTLSISFWTKFATPTNTMGIICVDNNSSVDRAIITMENSGKLSFFDRQSDSTNIYLSTTQYLRDVSAWYHILLAIDTTQATSSNRLKLYINGNQVTDFATANYGSQNYDTLFNLSSKVNVIGSQSIAGSKSNYLDGYLAEINFIDGTALTPTSFGETNSNGVWIPKKYTGSYGTNGFALEFDDSSDFGTDTSGNGNDFTATNLAATDQMQDTPHLNYATLNPLDRHPNNVLSEGNLQTVNTSGGGHYPVFANMAFTSGKWYAEFKSTGSDSGWKMAIMSIEHDGGSLSVDSTVGNSTSAVNKVGYGITAGNGTKQHNTTNTSYGSGLSTNDILMWAFDADNGKIWWGKNGTWFDSGDPASGTNEAFSGIDTDTPWTVCLHTYNNANAAVNFGNPPYTISSGNSDGDGYGNFEYAVPTGFYALNSKNLATYG